METVIYTAPTTSATLTHEFCYIEMSPAGGNGGGALKLLNAAGDTLPGTYLANSNPIVETLANGWMVAQRIYRNRFVPSYLYTVTAMSRGALGQVMVIHFVSGACADAAKASLLSLRFQGESRRVDSSGGPLELAHLPKSRSSVAPDGTRMGSTCLAGVTFCVMPGPVGTSCMCATPKGLKFGQILPP